MLDGLWLGMILAALLCAVCSGRLQELSAAVLSGAGQAVEVSLLLLGSLCAWSGFMEIARQAGLTQLLGQALSPLINRLFPDYRENDDVKGKISLNFAANLLGLGNAATPFGLSAMAAMHAADGKRAPSRGMLLFVVINTASLQILPLNMAAMRAACGSTAPFSILPQIWLTSLACLLTCAGACKILEKRS